LGRTDNFTYEVQVPDGTVPQDALAHAYAMTNEDNRPHGKEVCSTSVGDIMVFDGRHYFVDMMGFKQVTLRQSEIIQKLTSRELCFGFDAIPKKYGL
jgi:hypothetical protein